MATNAPAPSPNPQGGHKKLWLIIVALLLVLVTGAAIGGTYFFLQGSDEKATGETKKAEIKPPPKPVFVQIAPFTANVRNPDGRVLYVRLSLKVDDEAAAERVTEHMPQIRNRILMTLTDTEADTLTTAEGKRTLAHRLQVAVAEPFEADAEPIGIDNVLFTDFIVQ